MKLLLYLTVCIHIYIGIYLRLITTRHTVHMCVYMYKYIYIPKYIIRVCTRTTMYGSIQINRINRTIKTKYVLTYIYIYRYIAVRQNNIHAASNKTSECNKFSARFKTLWFYFLFNVRVLYTLHCCCIIYDGVPLL